MASIKKSMARKAVRSTAKHTAHGTAAKLRRDPLRATALLGLGALVGILAGLAIGRGGAATPAVSAP
jgi:hypothetical protein